MANWLTRRVTFVTNIFYDKARAVMGIFTAAFTLLMIFRDAILDPKYRDWFLFKFIPQLPWYWWPLIGLSLLLLITIESAYQKQQSEQTSFRKRYKTRLDEIRKNYRDELASVRLQEVLKFQRGAVQPVESTSESMIEGAAFNVSSALEEKPAAEVTPGAKLLAAKAPEKDQRIALFDTYVIPATFNGTTPHAARKTKDTFDVLIAEFVNSPNTRGWVSEIRYLQAQITYYDVEGKFYHRVSRCLWLEQDETYVHLTPDNKAKLLIAISFLDITFVAEKLDVNREAIYLSENSYRIQVNLSGSGYNEAFMFNLSLPEMTLTTEDN